MAERSVVRRLMVTAQNQIYAGNGAKGPYVLYEVFVVDEAGQPIEEKFRTFEQLPINELKEYRVTRTDHERHGVSYRLSPTDNSGRRSDSTHQNKESAFETLQGKLDAALKTTGDALRLVKHLEERVVVLEKAAGIEPADPPQLESQAPPEGADGAEKIVW